MVHTLALVRSGWVNVEAPSLFFMPSMGSPRVPRRGGAVAEGRVLFEFGVEARTHKRVKADVVSKYTILPLLPIAPAYAWVREGTAWVKIHYLVLV
jgi:hypothetical protein